MTPGPYAYADQAACIAGSRDAWKDSVEDYPGPGAYNLAKPVPSVREFIAQRRDGAAKGLTHAKRCTQASLYDEKKVDYPGPGSYTPLKNVQTKRRGFSFGHRPSLFGRSDSEQPGPGSYRANGSGGRRGGQSSWAASSVRRFPHKNPEHATPGPGEYGHQGNQGERRVERTGVRGLRPRPPSFDTLDTPGPGYYDPKLLSKGAPVTIKLRSSTAMESLSPGPGAYESPQRVGRKAPAYSIGMRLPATYACNPEPTEFNETPGRQRNGMAVTMGRHEFGRPSTARG